MRMADALGELSQYGPLSPVESHSWYAKFLGHPAVAPFRSFPSGKDEHGFDRNASLATQGALAFASRHGAFALDLFTAPHPTYGRNLELLQLRNGERFSLYRTLEGLEEHLLIDGALDEESIAALLALGEHEGYGAVRDGTVKLIQAIEQYERGEEPDAAHLARGSLFDAPLGPGQRDPRDFLMWAARFFRLDD